MRSRANQKHEKYVAKSIFRLNRTFVFVLFRNLNQLDIDFTLSLSPKKSIPMLFHPFACKLSKFCCFYFGLHVQNFVPKCNVQTEFNWQTFEIALIGKRSESLTHAVIWNKIIFSSEITNRIFPKWTKMERNPQKAKINE